MATWIAGGRGNGSVGAGATVYFGLGNGFVGAAAITTESNCQVAWRTATTLSRLYLYVHTNSRGASTFTLRVNGADGNQTLSVGSSATGAFQDTTNSDSISAGDTVNLKLVTGAGGTSFVFQVVGVESSAACQVHAATGTASTINTASSSNYWTVGTDLTYSTTEAHTQTTWRVAGTLKNLYCRVVTNGRSTTSTVKSRVNGGDGAQALSISGSATGVFEDTSNTDTLADADLVNCVTVLGTGGGNFVAQSYKVEFAPSSGSAYHHGCGGAGGGVWGAASTFGLIIGSNTGSATEANTQNIAGVAGVLSRLQAYLSANATTAASTLRTRVAGADGAQALSIGAGATGFFEDTSNSDTVAATDLINNQLVVGAGGSITTRAMSVRMTPSSSSVTVGLTGIAATAAVGLLGVALALGLSGASATGAAGTLTRATTVAVSGVQATGAAGTSAPATSTPVSGQAGTGATGSLSPTTSVGLTGASSTGAVGSVAPASSQAVTGVGGTGAVGSLAPATTVGLTGAAGTGQVGSVGAEQAGQVSLTGTSGTGQVGTLTPSTTVALTGVAGTGAVGTVVPSVGSTAALTGVAATGAVGQPAPSTTVPVTGTGGTGGTGTVGVPGVGLTGVAATGQVGTVTASVFEYPPGVNRAPTTHGIRRLRQTPHLGQEARWVFVSRFAVDLETGVGLTSGQGSDPQLMLQWSDDGGHTWSDEVWTSAGRIGAYRHRAVWRRLGRTRNRVFRVVVHDAVRWTLVDAFVGVS